jgi:hypothetical protein
VNCCPSNLLSGSTPPPHPPFPMRTSILYTRIQCAGGVGYGVLGLRQINTCSRVPSHVNFSMSLNFSTTALFLENSVKNFTLSRAVLNRFYFNFESSTLALQRRPFSFPNFDSLTLPVIWCFVDEKFKVWWVSNCDWLIIFLHNKKFSLFFDHRMLLKFASLRPLVLLEINCRQLSILNNLRLL